MGNGVSANRILDWCREANTTRNALASLAGVKPHQISLLLHEPNIATRSLTFRELQNVGAALAKPCPTALRNKGFIRPYRTKHSKPVTGRWGSRHPIPAAFPLAVDESGFSTQEVADYFGVSSSTVHRWYRRSIRASKDNRQKLCTFCKEFKPKTTKTPLHNKLEGGEIVIENKLKRPAPDGMVATLDAKIDRAPDIVITNEAPTLPRWFYVALVSALGALVGLAGIVVWLLVIKG